VRRWDIGAKGRVEAGALRRAGLVVAVSQRDADLLRADSLVVANGVDFPTTVPPLPRDGLTTFVGLLTYRPNSEAVAWWSDEVWPHLRDGHAPLTVIGRDGRSVAHRFAGRDGIELVGEVDDVGTWLERTTIVAVPLQHGSGTRLKVLEALAWGRAVVSTAKGVEGLPVVDGRDLLIVDGPADFAAAVRYLRNDHQAAARIATAGREFAEAFSWKRITPLFTSAVLEFRTGQR